MHAVPSVRKITLFSEMFIVASLLLLISVCIFTSPLRRIGLAFWTGMLVMSIICFIGSIPGSVTRAKIELKKNYIDFSMETHGIIKPLTFLLDFLAILSGHPATHAFFKRVKIEKDYIIKVKRGPYRLRKIIILLIGLFCLIVVLSSSIFIFAYHVKQDIFAFFGGMLLPLTVCAFLYVVRADVVITKPDGSYVVTISGFGKETVKNALNEFLAHMRS